MKVYHGSYIKIDVIDLEKCEIGKNFGRGFYVTKIKEQAEFWAERRGLSYKTAGFVTEFDFNENAFQYFRLNILQFDSYNEEWLDFVAINRNPKAKQPTHDYDIVEGPVADDKIATRIHEYLAGKVSKQDFLEELKFIRETHQICFCTTRSLQMLDYIENLNDISFEISKIGEQILEKLITENEIDELQATDLFYNSKTFTQLSDESTKLYEKGWEKIYEILRKELRVNIKKIALAVLCLLTVNILYAQSVIKGEVKDTVGNPIPWLQILLKQDGKVVNGAYTDESGYYQIFGIQKGTYNIVAGGTMACANTHTIKEISVSDSEVKFINITMTCVSAELQEIEVIYVPPVFSADNTTSSSKLTGDELRKTPGHSPTSSSAQSNIKSGMLTAGEVNDFAKWHLWGNILKKDFHRYTDMWGFTPLHRYIAQLTNKQGMPLSNAYVTLKSSEGDILWQAKTDNTGKAELWLDFFKSEVETSTNGLKLVFEYEGKTAEVTKVTPFEQGINTAQIDVRCNERNKVDLFFMIDATGSMSDEIRYLQVELEDITQKIHANQSELQLRTGCLVYRDHGDEYLTRKSSLSSDMNETLDFLRKQSAGGGGDYPEAVDIALYESITNEDWDDDALARILFIVLDAPSHTKPENIALLESQLRLAAEKGIRIVPIACSDIKKDGEYLMRTFALATNGTYLFLTDDSGIGNAHIKPTTDKYDVEKLNNAIVRVIKQYTKMPDCNNAKWAKQNKNSEPSDRFIPNPYDEKAEQDADKFTVSDIIKVYPNPCSDILKIETKQDDVKDIYLVDMTGKTLYGFNSPARNIIDVNVSRLATGIYFVKVFYKGKWFSEKFIKK